MEPPPLIHEGSKPLDVVELRHLHAHPVVACDHTWL